MGAVMRPTAPVTPTPHDVMLRDGSARLLRFRRPMQGSAEAGVVTPDHCKPILLVPSIINRWYVLDLRAGASLVEALVARGFDTWCLDWGAPGDEDRHLSWSDVIDRLARMVRAVRRHVGGGPIGMLGYCIGGTIAAIHAALQPASISALVNLAGPIDFSKAGVLAHYTNPEWFDPAGVVAAGNLPAQMMQSAFVGMRPTRQVGKWIGLMDTAIQARDGEHRRQRMAAFDALDAWASDNVAFPAAAYVTWIDEFYQRNLLVQGKHHVAGRRVDLAAIDCPLLTIVTQRDNICPPEAASALGPLTSSPSHRVISVPGGHVGAVVGRRATAELYPALADFFADNVKAMEQPSIASSGTQRSPA